MANKIYTLGEVCQFIRGLNVKTSEFGKGPPVILAKDLENGNILTKNLFKIKESVDLKRCNSSLIKLEDVVMIKDGSVGKFAINLTNQIFLAGSTSFKIIPDDDKFLSKKYLYYFLLTKKEWLKDCIKKGSTINHIDFERLSNMRIEVPPLEEQQRIVRILDKFSELERELEHRKKQYEYYRKLLIKGPAYSPPRNKYEFKEYNLKDVCFIHSGPAFDKNQYTEVGTSILSVKNILDGKVLAKDLYCCSIDLKEVPDKWKVQEDDVVMAKDGSHAGKVGINNSGKKFLLGSLVYKISPIDEKKILKKYLYFFFLGNKKKIQELRIEGIIPGIRKSKIERFKIWIPDLNRQEEIVRILDKFSGVGILEEISREIKFRRTQYEFYRSKIIKN